MYLWYILWQPVQVVGLVSLVHVADTINEDEKLVAGVDMSGSLFQEVRELRYQIPNNESTKGSYEFSY